VSTHEAALLEIPIAPMRRLFPESPSMTSLAGRVALVTGSTQGLGEGIARQLARAGAAVALNGRSADKGTRVLGELRALGADAAFFAADVATRDGAAGLVAATLQRFGRLDILVNNAQVVPPLLDTLDPAVDEAFEVALRSGLHASLRTARAAVPNLRAAGGGRIVNVASINGAFGSRYGAAYNATKEAIRGLTRTLANEWGRWGITVNAILPSGLSPAYEAFYRDDPKKADAVARLNPMRRHGRAEQDIGAAVLGLVGDDARFVTGVSLYVDGGSHLLGLPQLHSLPTGARS
jgi:NAD(P)-dependent dehydrogenase (short-subunit alcohol dehydrogenase family)